MGGVGGVVDLMLFRTNKNPFKNAKTQWDMTMAQVTAEKIKQKTKQIDPKNSHNAKLAIKEKDKKTYRNSGAQAVSERRHCRLQGVNSIKANRCENFC